MVMGDRTDSNDFIWLNDQWDGFRFRPTGGGSLDFTVAKDLLMHHYALVVEGNGTMSLYVDGELSQNKSWSDTRFQINAIGMAYTSTGLNFEGVLDDVRIYTNKLDATDVYTVYTNNTLVHALLDMDFEDGLTDKSAAGNDGTFQGTAAIVTNEPAASLGSNVLKLDGSGSSYVSLDRKISFGPNDSWSVILWARRAALTTHGMVIGERANDTDFIWLNDDFDGFRFRSNVADIPPHTADFSSPKDTKLHHYALVADGTGKLDFYLDGAFDESVTIVDTRFDIDSIGRAYSNGAYDFQGEVDNVKVFCGAFDAAMVQADYESGWNDDLLLHYSGDVDFADSSRSANDGSGSGNAAVVNSAPLVSVGSGALSFDGADNSYISLSNAISFSASDPWSIAFWAKRGEVGGQKEKGMVAGKLGNSADFIWLNDGIASGSDGFRFRSSTSATSDFTSPMDMLKHHYMLVANGSGGISLYVDGEPAGSLTGRNTSFYINAVGLAYPTSSLKYSFLGQIDDFRVYGAALDADAAADLYAMKNAESAPATSVTKVLVFLQGGQSNADGRAAPADLPTSPVNLQQPQSDVDFYYNSALSYLYPATSGGTQFGPEITCGRGLADGLNLNESNRVAIIKYAVGGTTLYSDWIAGGDATTSGDGPRYVSFQSAVTAGLAALASKYPDAEITIEGMTWMQGESDTASDSGSAAYYANMVNFIADVRLTYGLPQMPFVIGRLSINQTGVNKVANLPVVRDAQTLADTTVPWVGLVNTDSFSLKTDDLHFDADGQQSLGYDFADKLLYMIASTGTLIILN